MNNFLTALKAARCFVFFFFIYTFLSCNVGRNRLRVKIVNHPQLHKNHPPPLLLPTSPCIIFFSLLSLFSLSPSFSLCLVPFSFIFLFFLSCATNNNEDANNARLVGSLHTFQGFPRWMDRGSRREFNTWFRNV